MPELDADEKARQLAAASLEVHDPTGWFEQLYADSGGGVSGVPWDRGAPDQLLVQWAESRGVMSDGGLALVVGSGFGDDAEYVGSLGYITVAFDVSPSAVDIARRRHPGSSVDYLVADLLKPPAHWIDSFDLVVEVMTVQSLPLGYRRAATRNVSRLVAPGGTLLVVAAAREDDELVLGPPWPLTRAEVEAFATSELRPVDVRSVPDPTRPAVRRWCAELARGSASKASNASH